MEKLKKPNPIGGSFRCPIADDGRQAALHAGMQAAAAGETRPIRSSGKKQEFRATTLLPLRLETETLDGTESGKEMTRV